MWQAAALAPEAEATPGDTQVGAPSCASLRCVRLGPIDDGKSSLLRRLLHDTTRSV